MADNVSKLKELLFDEESSTLAVLAQRIESLAEVERHARAELVEAGQRLQTATDLRLQQLGRMNEECRALQSQIEQRLSLLAQRTGTPEALKTSVAEVIDDVIIEARETKQDDLSRALAPMLVKTIKAELKNNQAEMVEALYPITGQLVKAYVASAMKDLTNRMNRRLQSNPVMLRVRSLLSGYSLAELTLAETQQLEVEELYIIRRGSGELLQRWPANLGRSNSDIHMSGVIAAINDFAANAFQTDGGHLRSFNLDDFTVFLRASPIYLLAAKCRGVPAPGVETLIDTEFLAAVARQHAAGNANAPDVADALAASPMLAELQSRIEDGITQRHEVLANAGLPFHPLRALAAIVVLGLLAGLGWLGWTTWEMEVARASAQRSIAATDAMKGYPVIFDVGYRGRSLTISGLAPSQSAKAALLDRLATDLPGVALEEKGLAVLPGQGPDLTPQVSAVRRELGGLQSSVRTEISSVEAALRQQLSVLELQTARASMRRSLDRSVRRLEDALPDLRALSGLREQPARAAIATVLDETEKTIAAIGTEAVGVERLPAEAGKLAGTSAGLAATAVRLRSAAARISGSSDAGGATSQPRGNSERAAAGPVEAAEEVALAAERLATVAAAAVHMASIRIPEPPRILPPSAHDRLVAFAAANAVFFGNNEEFRDPGNAAAVIAEIARLARDAKVLVRVVGYTDERGGQTRNSQLAQNRADKVTLELVAKGLPRQQIVAIGRALGPDISPVTGPESANRRVQFEVGFVGEPAAGP